MQPLIQFVIAVLFFPILAFGQWAWLTDEEPLPPDSLAEWGPFCTGDTINGRVHSNDRIAIVGAPVFHDQVTSAASGFWEGLDYAPEFDQTPLFNTAQIPIPNIAGILRDYADRYEDPGWDKQQRMVINGSDVTLYTWDIGVAFPSLDVTVTNFPISGNDGLCFFTEVPLELTGVNITGAVTIGSARRVRLIDDVRVAGPYDEGAPYYRVSEANPNYVGVVCEEDIKIANHPTNGMENSSGHGFGWGNQNETDIAITAAIVTGGSFEFEQQNDVDSGYVCECTPDQRGSVRLCGSVVQQERGFLRRSNNGGTGYRLYVTYDTRFLLTAPPCFIGPSPDTPDSVDFGDVVFGETAYDTVHVYVAAYSTLGAVTANTPFAAERIEPWFGTHFVVPVSFTPPATGIFFGMLNVSTTYEFFQIALRGRGVPGGAPPLAEPEVYPNPFNTTTSLRFELEQSGSVTAELFDVTGRRVAMLADQDYMAGKHQVRVDGTSLASGLYFVHLNMSDRQSTHKLMLIK